MRLRHLSLRGLTCYRDTVSIDFEALGPGLIAITGRNGQGKTTAMEAPAAALFKALPTRPRSLYDYAHGRDAFVEAVFLDGDHELKVRIQIDAERRTTEGYLFEDGVAITTGRAAEFDAEVARRFGSQELFLASVFATQDKSGDFLRMRKGDRKALFAELLGLGILEVLAQTARTRRAVTESDLVNRREFVAGAAREVEAVLPVVEEDLAVAQVDVDAAAKVVDVARTEETAAQAAVERARAASARLEALAAVELAASQAAAEAHLRLQGAEDRPTQAARRRDERLDGLDERRVQDMEPEYLKRHAEAVAALERRAGEARKLLQEEDQVREAARRWPLLRTERTKLDDERRDLEQLRPTRERLEREAGHANIARRGLLKMREDHVAELRRRAELLAGVPCAESKEGWLRLYGDAAQDLAGTCPLLADARNAKEEATTLAGEPTEQEIPAIARAREADAAWKVAQAAETTGAERLRAVLRRLHDLDIEMPAVEDLAARIHLVDQAKTTLEAIEGERRDQERRLDDELDAARAAVAAAKEHRTQIEADYQADQTAAILAIAEAEKAHQAAAKRHADAVRAVEDERDAGDLRMAEIDLADQRRLRVMAETELRTADQLVATLRARLEQLQVKAAKLVDLRRELQATETELGDWRLLEQGLGKDGVQALEIDAAGPEVAQLTNELLTACYGPRFSISLETLRTKRDGTQAEAFDVRVYDGGQERVVEDLSGGEKVILSEALSLALAIFNSRKNAVRWETYWRDETAGALDPENAAAYVRMLRRARELAGAFQIVFVAHQPEVYEAADVRLVVEGGRIQVEAAAAA